MELLQKKIIIAMFDFVKNFDIIEQACSQFVRTHQTFYNISNDIIPEIAKYPNLRFQSQEVHTTLTVNNSILHNRISLQLVKNMHNNENCIVYLHGLSSYCIQGKFLIPFLGDNLSLCLYDSRGHGKNKAQYVTYGLLESIELFQILKVLTAKGFKNIILWGRSMGAVACLRIIQQYKDDPIIRNVKYVVADSPFSSFKKIATELVCKMVMLPEFISGIVADAFAEKIKDRYGIDLKEINFQQIISRAPVTFLHSSNDEMMGKQHITEITQNFIGDRQMIDIEVTHNEQRPKWVIHKLINTIKELLRQRVLQRKNSESKKRGLSITKMVSSKYINMVTPTSIPKSAQKIANFIPHVSFERRKTCTSSNTRSKENLDYYRKSTVQQISKYSSVQLNKFSKSTTNRQKLLKNKLRKSNFDNFV